MSIRVFVRLNETLGPAAYATGASRVIISDAEARETFDVVAGVVTPGELSKLRAQARRRDEVNRSYAPAWIYAGELDADAMRLLFRKRGHRTAVIDEEDGCGDDTAQYFARFVSISTEAILVTQDGWRIFRTLRHLEDWEAQDD